MYLSVANKCAKPRWVSASWEGIWGAGPPPGWAGDAHVTKLLGKSGF